MGIVTVPCGRYGDRVIGRRPGLPHPPPDDQAPCQSILAALRDAALGQHPLPRRLITGPSGRGRAPGSRRRQVPPPCQTGATSATSTCVSDWGLSRLLSYEG